MNLKCQSQTVDLHVFKVKAFPFGFIVINIKLKEILLYTLASVYIANFSSMLLGMCSGCAILKLTEASCCEKGKKNCNCVQLLGLLFVLF